MKYLKIQKALICFQNTQHPIKKIKNLNNSLILFVLLPNENKSNLIQQKKHTHIYCVPVDFRPINKVRKVFSWSRKFSEKKLFQFLTTEIFDQLREVRDDELPWFSESLQQVTLRVQKSARWIVESYPYVSRVDNADGSVDLTMSVTSSHWLGRLLLRAGKGVKVLKPAQYKNLATETAQSVLSRYSASNSTSNSAS